MTTTSPLITSLLDQHNRSFCMLADAVQLITPTHWHDAATPRLVPARLVYHILIAAERYTSTGTDEAFRATRRYNLNWMEAPLDKLLDYPAALPAIEAMRQQIERWHHARSDQALLTSPADWSWTGPTLLTQSLYLLRHTSYHVADLNTQLRNLSFSTAKWE